VRPVVRVLDRLGFLREAAITVAHRPLTATGLKVVC